MLKTPKKFFFLGVENPYALHSMASLASTYHNPNRSERCRSVGRARIREAYKSSGSRTSKYAVEHGPFSTDLDHLEKGHLAVRLSEMDMNSSDSLLKSHGKLLVMNAGFLV